MAIIGIDLGTTNSLVSGCRDGRAAALSMRCTRNCLSPQRWKTAMRREKEFIW